ncbi:MAG: hypothetical protein AW08_01998 [Candidatus Accumulibacter adjunctus]|uniref:Uncharacterized protein n=1 Tax=Candidatus Accumulibacter adjunctus TaxID=1454001 RepID=A0A011NS82_9PROT|nr:MAG: hypothetical protein AW08_01998 [Candidatus Accumulibacter adjunctus]
MNQQLPDGHGPARESGDAGSERRRAGDRRQIADRRSGSDRRRPADLDPLLAELESRVASALRQRGGGTECNGSGWDKIIVPMP